MLDSKSWPPSAQRTLAGILRQKSELHPDKEFVVFEDGSWTYAAFETLTGKLARGLVSQGIGQGDKVALMLQNSIEFMGIWFASARIGAVEVPVNTNIRGPLLRHILHHSDSRIIVVHSDYLESLQRVIAEVPQLETVVVVGDPAQMPDTTVRVLRFADLETDIGPLPDVSVDAMDPAAIIFTSGTTGPSKGVVLPHNYFWWFGTRCAALRDVCPGERLYTCLPLFHANAQAVTVVPALVSGETAILDTHFTASGFWQRLRDFGATQFNYIGGMIPILMKQPPRQTDRNHSLRIGLGAAAPKNLWTDFEGRFGVKLIECYGQTEDCVATINPLGATRIGSIGKAEWGFEMEIHDDDGHAVPDGTVGEIVVRPSRPGIMMSGYYKMPDETLDVFKNLWFHTGDFGSRDADGYFYFVDRKKDAIRRRGENISAFEVELVLNEHPDVQECAVFAVPSEVGEDDVMAAVILRPGVTLDPEALIRFCEGNLAYFAIPRYLDFRTEFPKTPTHRVEKYKLRDTGVTPTTWDREAAGYALRR